MDTFEILLRLAVDVDKVVKDVIDSSELPSQQAKQIGAGEQRYDDRVGAWKENPPGGESRQSNVS